MAIPSAHFDGVLKEDGTNPYNPNATFFSYLDMYNERIAIPALQDISINIEKTTNLDYKATIDVTQIFPINSKKLFLRAVLTKSGFKHQAKMYNHSCRRMFPDSMGINLDFSNSNNIQQVFNFSFNSPLEKDSCELIVFVQEDSTKEVTQAAIVKLKIIDQSIKSFSENTVSVYPIPAKDFISISSQEKSTIELYAISGKLLYSGVLDKSTMQISTSAYPPGFYFIRIYNNKNVIIKKIEIIK